MIYRVLYWLGVSMAMGARLARVLYAMASSVRQTAPSGQQATAHAVRHLRGEPLVRSTPSRGKQQPVGKPTKTERLPAPGAVADRVKTVDLYAGNLLLGVMWIYMYPESEKARRVLKIQDRHLAQALGWERWYYTDVPFNAKHGIDAIVKAFHTEVSRQLDQRIVQAEKARTKERLKQEQKASQVAVKAEASSAAPAPQVVEQQPAKPTAAPAPKAESASNVIAPANKRHVKGETVSGTVTLAGMTKKLKDDGSSYNTFCLTIHDGVREIPLFGTELGRLVADMEIRAGEKINVVFMGKQKMSAEGEPARFKNLYQITRLNA